eukprot:8317279-Alexandrium_andersonii.AAC.1
MRGHRNGRYSSKSSVGNASARKRTYAHAATQQFQALSNNFQTDSNGVNGSHPHAYNFKQLRATSTSFKQLQPTSSSFKRRQAVARCVQRASSTPKNPTQLATASSSCK